LIPRILIIDDEIEVGDFFTFLLEPKSYDVKVVVNGAQAREAFKEPFHLAIIDLKLPDTDGTILLRELKTLQPECEGIIMTGYSTVKTAVEAIQLGAFDYIEKPFTDLRELETIIDQALARATSKVDTVYDQRKQVLNAIGLVTGHSEKMQKLLTVAEKLAKKDVTILIRGETGTGKESLARFIHAMSPRVNKPFMAINCGALPENLLESELFGYEKGAFTGASSQRKGIFELAHCGTLFLDEIGDASHSIQVKLLRVLETGEILRIGGEKPVHVDVRILAATNADLEELVKKKLFREDMFYRLDVVTLILPPLRERKEDILLLAEHFLSRQYPAGRIPRLSSEVVAALKNYEWPGNVRELSNIIAQVATTCDGPTVLIEHLPPKIFLKSKVDTKQQAQLWYDPVEVWFSGITGQVKSFVEDIDLAPGFDLSEFLGRLRQIEVYAAHYLIERALKEAMGSYPTAAKTLKTTPRVLRYLRKEKH